MSRTTKNNFGFFKAIENSSQIDDILLEIKKQFEAQIEYNKLLAEQFVRADDITLVQLLASFHYGDLLQNEQINYKEVAEKLFDVLGKDYGKEAVNACIYDINRYENLMQVLTNAKEDFDRLGIHLLVQGDSMASDIQKLEDRKGSITLLSMFVGSEQKAKRLYKKSRSYNCPAMADKELIEECRKLLKPKLTSACQAYLGAVRIIKLGDSEFICEGNFFKNTKKRLEDKKNQFRMQNGMTNNDPRLSGINFKLGVISDDLKSFFKISKNPYPSGKLEQNIIDTFINTYKPLYLKVEEFQQSLVSLSKQCTNNDKQIKVDVSEKQTSNKKSVESTPHASKRIEGFLKNAPEAPPEAVTSKIEVADRKNTVEKSTEIAITAAIREEPIQTSAKRICPPVKVETAATTTTALERWRQTIIQKLNSKHIATLNKVFSLKKDRVCTLRELVSLAVALGGEISTSGRNRCKIKLKNIYAFVLTSVPSELLSYAKDVTLTMHGGGHRKRPSQNHDRGIALPYLVEQFKAAFKRANCTPELLGLKDLDEIALTSENTSKLSNNKSI